MNVMSLFDGIAGCRLALERVGLHIDKYYSSEVNPISIGITTYNFPDTIHIGDVRFVDGMKYTGSIDLLTFGSPCQNFSMSGKGQGASTKTGVEVVTLEQYLDLKNNGFEFDGYSYLFWEAVRLLHEIKPKYFFMENVKMSKKWERVITEALGVEPVLINSALVSGQSRNRLYWTNIPDITQPEDKGIFIKDVLEDTYSDKERLSDFVIDRYKELPNCSFAVGTTKPDFRTIGQRDYVYGDNNKMACLVATDYKQPKQVLHNGIIRKISPIEAERFQTLPDDYTKYAMIDGQVKLVSNTKRFECIGNGWTIDVIVHIFKNIR